MRRTGLYKKIPYHIQKSTEGNQKKR